MKKIDFEFNGEAVKLPIKVGYKALKNFMKDLDGKNEEESLDTMESLLWHGYLQGCKAAGHEPKLKRSQMEDVMDHGNNFQIFQSIYTAAISNLMGKQ